MHIITNKIPCVASKEISLIFFSSSCYFYAHLQNKMYDFYHIKREHGLVDGNRQSYIITSFPLSYIEDRIYLPGTGNTMITI